MSRRQDDPQFVFSRPFSNHSGRGQFQFHFIFVNLVINLILSAFISEVSA